VHIVWLVPKAVLLAIMEVDLCNCAIVVRSLDVCALFVLHTGLGLDICKQDSGKFNVRSVVVHKPLSKLGPEKEGRQEVRVQSEIPQEGPSAGLLALRMYSM
jgi:hypothetical protein